MPRPRRFVLPESAHHVTIRGNFRQPVFYDDEDRRLYVQLLLQSCERFGIEIHAYCLMTNHVHLVAVPLTEWAFSKAFHNVHGIYATRVNQKLERTGHLFERRYFAAILDTPHYWSAMAYVEQNPVRAHLVEKAWDWEWSSARIHSGLAPNHWLTLENWSAAHSPESWKTILQEGVVAGEMLLRIRHATQSGRPLGSPEFLDRLEQILEAPVRPSPRGRPKMERKMVPGPLFRAAYS